MSLKQLRMLKIIILTIKNEDRWIHLIFPLPPFSSPLGMSEMAIEDYLYSLLLSSIADVKTRHNCGSIFESFQLNQILSLPVS